jgi:hypothetical protein
MNLFKYGTHVITNYFNGTKFEALYRCKFSPINGFISYSNGDVCEDLFINRMGEFTGGIFGIFKNPINTNTQKGQTDEQLIYNSIGSKNKICGMINTTDYNPDSIQFNAGSVFGEGNIKTQFIKIGSNGIIPIYELINDENKKQEVKVYIEGYLTRETVN